MTWVADLFKTDLPVSVSARIMNLCLLNFSGISWKHIIQCLKIEFAQTTLKVSGRDHQKRKQATRRLIRPLSSVRNLSCSQCLPKCL